MAKRNGTFSASVREELLLVDGGSRHCRIAEAAAICFLTGNTEEEGFCCASSEYEGLIRKDFTLIGKAFNIILVNSKCRRGSSGKARYELTAETGTQKRQIRKAFEDRNLLRKDCCRRSFLRGAFLAAGTVSDPEKAYRLEIVSREQEKARFLRELMAGYLNEPKMTTRRGGYVVYLQEADDVVKMLGLIGAHSALLSLENTRIVRELRGNIARKVNCEASNLGKTVQAAARQTKDIEFLRESGAFSTLPENLLVIAQLRLTWPDASLTELGELAEPHLTRSGVNHRLRRLSGIAEEMRKRQSCSNETGGNDYDEKRDHHRHSG